MQLKSTLFVGLLVCENAFVKTLNLYLLFLFLLFCFLLGNRRRANCTISSFVAFYDRNSFDDQQKLEAVFSHFYLSLKILLFIVHLFQLNLRIHLTDTSILLYIDKLIRIFIGKIPLFFFFQRIKYDIFYMHEAGRQKKADYL